MRSKDYMKMAIAIAKNNIEHNGGPFGAIIVKDGEIISSASNLVTEMNDPTAHAEVNAIRIASRKLATYDLSGCEIYSSCEPCPMCLGAIYWARIDKIYFAATREDAKNAGFDDSFLYQEINTEMKDRKIPTKQIMDKSSLDPFKAWKDYDNKKLY